jgi:hypothetical protein
MPVPVQVCPGSSGPGSSAVQVRFKCALSTRLWNYCQGPSSGCGILVSPGTNTGADGAAYWAEYGVENHDSTGFD